METRLILLALGLLLAVHAGAEVWRWVDDDGVVHFSDTPREGAVEVDVSAASRPTGAQVYRYTRPRSSDEPTAPEEATFRYDSLSITSPGAEETLWNIDGILNVSIALSPGLQPGHRVRVYFNGEPRLESSTSFTIDEVWRGVHNLQVEVIDETGKLMIRSRPNRFYVQQNSVITPGAAPGT